MRAGPWSRLRQERGPCRLELPEQAAVKRRGIIALGKQALATCCSAMTGRWLYCWTGIRVG